jgi:hypothetical protein
VSPSERERVTDAVTFADRVRQALIEARRTIEHAAEE